MHEIQFKEGGVCSEHLHAHRYNAFYVISGCLRLRVWNNEERPDIIDLMPTQTAIVPPGVYHQFEAITAGRAIEVYWVV
jgi:quercetin dioxygenase-like cupin family protein